MKSITLEWIHRAEEDYTVAKGIIDFHPPPYSAICYHAQQCIEKYLKAILQEQQVKFGRIHVSIRFVKNASHSCQNWSPIVIISFNYPFIRLTQGIPECMLKKLMRMNVYLV